MHDIQPVQLDEGSEYLVKEKQSPGFGKHAFALDHVFEGAVSTELEDEVDVVGRLELAVVLHDVFVLHDLESADLAVHELPQLVHLADLLDADRLDGECFTGLYVLGFPDLPILTAPDDLGQHVVLHDLAHA